MLSFRLFHNQQFIDDSRLICNYPQYERTISPRYFFNPKSVAHGDVDCEDLLVKPFEAIQLRPRRIYMPHGRIEIDTDRCKGCELCRSACPQDVIKLADDLNNKGYWPAVLLDPEYKCTGCALCAVVCPDGCITVYREVSGRTELLKKEARHHVRATA